MTPSQIRNMREDLKNKAIEWVLSSNDTGVSSRALLKGCLGYEAKWHEMPSDADDFGRCYRLVETVPELKNLFFSFKTDSERWIALLSRWDELSSLFKQEEYTMLYDILQDLKK